MRAYKRVAVLASAVLAMTVAPPQGAEAHGPCDECVAPASGVPGDTIRVRWWAIKVVFNPMPSQVPYHGSLWKVYQSAEPSITEFTSAQPRSSSFRLPDLRPGVYVVAIFDGSEGGQHYTWAYVRVLPGLSRETGPSASS